MWKYTFKAEWVGEYIPGRTVKVHTEDVTLDDLSESLTAFLKAVGFVFKEVEIVRECEGDDDDDFLEDDEISNKFDEDDDDDDDSEE